MQTRCPRCGDERAGRPSTTAARVYGTRCWCPDWFADILEHPHAFAFPCTWPTPIAVDRRIPPGGEVEWEGVAFSFEPHSGHTRFSAAIGFEVDGLRFAHLGDQIHSFPGVASGAGHDYLLDWAKEDIWPGHVYRNGAWLDSFRDTARWLHGLRPDVVLSGHQPPIQTDELFFRRVAEWGERYAAIHEVAMVLGDGEAHFGLDSLAGWITPYRSHVAEPGQLTVVATLRNPLPRRAELEARLVGPPSRSGSAVALVVEPRAESRFELTMIVDSEVRRQPIAVELLVDGRSFGQVAEALVTVGGRSF